MTKCIGVSPQIFLGVMLFCSIQWKANAAIGCPARKDILGDLADVNAPLKVSQIDSADRRTANDFAAEHDMTAADVKQRYAASGDLDCGGAKSSANVTLVGDVITTAAHSINAGGNKCIDLKKPPKCTFLVEVGGDKFTYETAGVVDSGWDCNSTDREHTGSDWAVMKLVKKVDPRIKPYKIDADLRLRFQTNTPVIAIGRSIDWPNDVKSKDLLDHPRHYGDCQLKQPVGTAIQTNCDISGGSSGGALVTPGPDPILIGVHQMSVFGGSMCPKPNFAKRSGPYSICWASQSTLATTEFADAIEKAAAESNRSHP